MPPSTHLERRLLWHPRHENKFVVGGGPQITLYEWSQTDSIRHVTSQLDLQHMRCFAWSPDPAFDDLFAVGNSTGRVDILRLQPYKPAAQSNVLSNGPIVHLPARTSRAWLEKVRGDCSLVIWDVQTAKATLNLSNLLPTTPSAYADFTPLPRIDIGPRADPRILQQHAPTEVVSCLSFLPDTTDTLLAGISQRWLRMLDLRSPHAPATNAAAKVHGITVDPFDSHRVACYGDGVITMWDTRRFSHPLLTFTEKDAAADGGNPRFNSTYTNLEFSSSRRGTLASMEKDSYFVRLWNTMDITTNVSAGENISRESSMSRQPLQAQPKRSWTNLSWSAPSTSARPAVADREQMKETVSTTILHNTHRTKMFPTPLASFALVPSSQPHPLTSNIMAVAKDGALELYAFNDAPKSSVWGRRGDFSVSAGQSTRIFFGLKDEDKTVPEPWEVQGNPIISASVSRSASNTGLEDSQRLDGKTRTMSPPAMFGRGDEDGFPALLTTSIRRRSSDGHSGSRQRRSVSRTLQVRQQSAKRDKPAQTPAHSPSRPGEDDRGRPRRKPTGSRAARAELKGITSVIQDDISMVMWRRTVRGYSLSDHNHNANIMREKKTSTHDMSAVLGDVWSWISQSQEYLSVPKSREYLSTPNSKINGYDFAYEGLRGIWEGVPMSKTASVSDKNQMASHELLQPLDNRTSSKRSSSPSAKDIRDPFLAALQILSARRGQNMSWKPTTSTSKPIQRQVALQLCGWSMKEEDLNNNIRRWEKEKQISRAACWLTFTKQQGKASMLLLQSDDELHHMMSGTLAALSAQNARNSDLREHCERLIVKVQDPYFRAMLTYLTLGDWSEVLDEEILPFHERLAIAFQFLDDKALSSYLRRCTERASLRGDIDALIVTGLTPSGMDILQGYVDRTGDVQTAAILSSLVCPWKFTDTRHERWLESYRDLLDGFKLHHFRVAFDVDRGQILQGAIQDGDYEAKAIVPSQILIRCNYCNKTVNPAEAPSQVSKPTVCPHCNRSLPRCSICLLTLSIIYDSTRNAELAHASEFRDTIDEAIVICQSCRHGGHSSHILDWFFTEDGGTVHDVCPVADCDCRCAEAF